MLGTYGPKPKNQVDFKKKTCTYTGLLKFQA